MSIQANEIRVMARGETNTLLTDWGENSQGQETGVLKNGDTVSSATVSVDSKPTGADDPTLGSVTAPASAEYVNDRSCSAGEWTRFNVTTSATQTAGQYRLKVTATTANGKVIPRFVRVDVRVP